MRAVLQRVLGARVEVDGQIVSSIGPGILVLVGLLDIDTEADAEYMCRKILNTRLFHNEKTGKGWDQSVMQKNFEVLLVSQFTLYGQLKGNKLDFHVAMPPERAKPFYESLVRRVATAYRPDAVKDGKFGAMMQVHLINDGPVTIQLDSQKAGSSTKEKDQSYPPVIRADSGNRRTGLAFARFGSSVSNINNVNIGPEVFSSVKGGSRPPNTSRRTVIIKTNGNARFSAFSCIAVARRSHPWDYSRQKCFAVPRRAFACICL